MWDNRVRETREWAKIEPETQSETEEKDKDVRSEAASNRDAPRQRDYK